MHITAHQTTFKNTTNKIVSQLGVVGSEGETLETLDQLQLSSARSTGKASYNLGRTVKLVRAQGHSAVNEKKARNLYLAAAGTLAVGIGMMTSGDVLTSLGGVAVTLGALAPTFMGIEQSKAAQNVLTDQRETSYDDGIISRDDYYYSRDTTAGYQEEAFQSALAYGRRANENSEWLIAR